MKQPFGQGVKERPVKECRLTFVGPLQPEAAPEMDAQPFAGQRARPPGVFRAELREPHQPAAPPDLKELWATEPGSLIACQHQCRGWVFIWLLFFRLC